MGEGKGEKRKGEKRKGEKRKGRGWIREWRDKKEIR